NKNSILTSQTLHESMLARSNSHARSSMPSQGRFVVTVNIPSRERSAIVVPATGLSPSVPCQGPAVLWSPPALKQAIKAFLFLDDIASWEWRSLGGSSDE